MLGNQVELWEAMLAVAKLGAVIMPTTGALGPADLADRITRGGARFVIANADDTAKFDDVDGRLHPHRRRRTPSTGWHRLRRRRTTSTSAGPFTAATTVDDPMLIYFTSGTTSKPKLVEHSQVSYPVGHLSTMAWIGVRPGDVHLAISSPGWAKHAWSCFFAPWIAEATIFVYNYSRFDAAALLNQLRRAGVNTFCAPPTVWRMLIQSDLGPKPEGLREILGAGEPLNPDVIAQVERAWGLTIRDGFGQTETTLQVGNTPGQPVKPGSMGRPMPGVPVVLVDPLTGELADEGEICLDLQRDPVNLMTGYLGDPQRNAAVMAGGYYHTGDVASRDEDGYITYIGRTDDVFKSSDYKVSPFELESVLIEHPAVVEAAVVPQPDETRLCRAEGVCLAGRGLGAERRNRKADHGVRPRPPGAVPEGAPRRVLRTAQDDLGQDPPGRASPPRGGRARGRHADRDRAPLRGSGGPMKSYDAGPTDTPILEETIGANFERIAAHLPGCRRAGRRRQRTGAGPTPNSMPRSTSSHGV